MTFAPPARSALQQNRVGMAVAVGSIMLETQILFGAASTLALAIFFARRFRSRSVSLEVPPVSEGWLAERRRVREDLVG